MNDYQVFNRVIGDLSGEIVEAQGLSRRHNLIGYEYEKAQTALVIKQGIRATLALGALVNGVFLLASPTPAGLLGTIGCVLGANFVNNAMKFTFLGAMEK